MQINEIFSSIEGEGIRAGYLATFIRTQFCNLRCSYCDTPYSLTAEKNLFGYPNYKDISVEEILSEVNLIGNKRVTFTGGEPLIQEDAHELVDNLLKESFEVNIETNGATPIDDFVYFKNRNLANLIITMDWKSPYSGMRSKMLDKNLTLLRPNDVLKFVVANVEDLNDMKETMDHNDLHCHIFVSPVFGQIEGSDIVAYLKQKHMQNVRVQCQIHKIFWSPEQRGV